MSIAIVSKGSGGFGTPLEISVEGERNEITGGEAVDGFRKVIPDKETACVIVNCGGTLRLGMFPKKGLKTINVNPAGPSGPFAAFVKAGIYVSGVTPRNIESKEG